MEEYCIFKKTGELVFTINGLKGVDSYVNNEEYIIVKSKKLEPSYAYSLVDGVIVKGEKFPTPPTITSQS